MDRRQFQSAAAVFGLLTLASMRHAYALTLADMSNADATKGLKTALEKGALSAIGILGVQDGFLGNSKVRIGLPPSLNDAANLLRTLGQGAHVDELVTAMNRGAEAAVPMARDLLLQAVQTMNVGDAKGILDGGETAVTQFFASKTRTPLAARFLPHIIQATERVDLAAKYNALAGKAADMGLLKREDANIQHYVTARALDGLFFMIAEEERRIRQNPVGYGSAILTKVFGAIR